MQEVNLVVVMYFFDIYTQTYLLGCQQIVLSMKVYVCS